MHETPTPILSATRHATKAEQVFFLQSQIRSAQQRVDKLSDQLVRVISTPDARG